MSRFILHWLHPLALAGSLGLWWLLGGGLGALFAAFLAIQAVLFLLQRAEPARPAWRIGPGKTLALIGAAMLLALLTGLVSAVHEALLALVGPRTPMPGLGGWPVAVQVVALYFGADFIYYWIHRAIHRWPWLWRASGHGVHHAFHQLHAAHAGVSHPFELVLLALPMVLLSTATGATDTALSAATLLLFVNASLAHANLRMATPVLSWLVTGSEQHRRHHSVVFEESNSNYACNAILWDRLFGTFGGPTTAETGIAPREPGIGELLLLPFREPADADTVSSRQAG